MCPTPLRRSFIYCYGSSIVSILLLTRATEHAIRSVGAFSASGTITRSKRSCGIIFLSMKDSGGCDSQLIDDRTSPLLTNSELDDVSPMLPPSLQEVFATTPRKRNNLDVGALKSSSSVFNITTTFRSLSSISNNNTEELPPSIVKSSGSSGIDKLPTNVQSVTVLSMFVTFGAVVSIIVLIMDALTLRFEVVQSWRYAWPLVGVLFMWSGVSQLLRQVEYTVLYPPQGTWGFWNMPDWYSPIFHVRWTGAASILGGIGLLVGGCMDAFFPVWYTSPDFLGTCAGLESDSAAILLLVTLFAALPTSMYMYTHDEEIFLTERATDGDSDDLGTTAALGGHAGRAVMLAVLVAQLYDIGAATFYSWGEALHLISS